jgi:hypothetical protein
MTDLPCDCEMPTLGTTPAHSGAKRLATEAPAVAAVGHLCNRGMKTLPCRTFAQAVRDVSKVRDLDDWVWEELHRRRHTAEVISLAHARAERRRT